MAESTRIFWFSGTGNSLYAAKQLAMEFENAQLVQITNEAPSGIVGGKGEKIGFVFPLYYINIPRAVRAFVEKLEIKPDTYIFIIETMGAIGYGSIATMKNALKAKGHKLSYSRGLRMPANNVLLYNPAEPSKHETMSEKINAKIKSFAADIKTETQSIKSLPFSMKTLYKNIQALDSKFTVGEKCIGCEICEKLCPVRNIKMENDKPKWLHRCEHCVACISWCPTQAIEYGNKTQARRRYRNPKIKVEELIRK
jgi:formate hydrogenlyase subunit 6/NADH:ubiquinone oxidoreductase subunit I